MQVQDTTSAQARDTASVQAQDTTSAQAQDTTATKTISFSPDNSNPGSNSVIMAENKISGDTLEIDIKANIISANVFGIAFHLNFNSSILVYDGYTHGSLFENVGSPGYQISLKSGASNELLIGISQGPGETGVNGSGTFITLRFKVVAIGASTLTYTYQELEDPRTLPILGITWDGGTVVVQ
ncbi:MAG: cohesin domain-containing protein [bacterium]